MRRRRRRHLSLLAAAALVLAACSNEPAPDPQPLATQLATQSATATASPPASEAASPSPVASGPDDLTARAFTVLVLGADTEGRTDTMMVVGVDAKTKTLSIASIPRDTIDVPLPGGGRFTNQKINAFYNQAAAHPETYPAGPARATVDMVGILLGIRIDFYARTGFGGFTRLVDAVGGVDISLPRRLTDPNYQVTPSKTGVTFPAGPQTLNGQRALIFVRTRQADNDFERQRRQQAFLLAAGKQLLAEQGLLSLLLAARGDLDTDFPLDQVLPLAAAVGKVDDWTIKSAVLGPDRYEMAASCPCGYALAPKLAEFAKLGALYYPWAVRG